MLDDSLVVAFSEPTWADDWGFAGPTPRAFAMPVFDEPDEVWFAAPAATLAPPAGLVRQMAGEFADSEVFKRAAQHANVTSWSSKEVMDRNGTIHRVVTTCKGDNCTTSEEKTTLPANTRFAGHHVGTTCKGGNCTTTEEKTTVPVNASLAGAAQNASNFEEQDLSDISEAMRGFAGEMGQLRPQFFEPGEFDDMLGSVFSDFGLSSPEPAVLPMKGGGNFSANMTEGSSYSESSEVFVKDGKLHQKITKCEGSKCTTKERTEDIGPAAGGAAAPAAAAAAAAAANASKAAKASPQAKSDMVF